MKRRDFLIGTALFLISGKILGDNLIDFCDKYNEKKRYYDLPNYIYDIETKGNIKGIPSTRKREISGKGIFYNDTFITVAHVLDLKNIARTKWEKTQEYEYESYINGKKLEKKLIDFESDVAIFNLPDDLIYENFPGKIDTKIIYGKDVYMLGDPYGEGLNIRKGKICDLDGLIEKHKNYFGISCPTISGDSGTPVVNKYGELMGLTALTVNNSLGYIKKIEEFIK